MDQPHVILVGFGPGVGLGIAKAFGASGFRLSLISRSLADGIADLAGFSFKHFRADAGEARGLTEAIEQAILEMGPPEVLIYNAFKFAVGKPSTIEPEKLTSDFNINVSGALAATRVVLPLMLERKFGTVLYTGGGWAIYPSSEYASASIGKGGLRSLAFMFAEEFAATGVRFGTVTIMGSVQRGTAFDPGKIGDAFLKMHQTPTDQFPVELRFTGA